MAAQTTARITVDMGDGELYTMERLPNGGYQITAGTSGISWTVLGDSPVGGHYAQCFTGMQSWRDRTEAMAKALNGNQPEPAVLNA